MKIAIPTNDAININKDLDSAKGFVVFTIQLGEIVREEFRQQATDSKDTFTNVFTLLNDCSHCIVSRQDEKSPGSFPLKDIQISLTKETIITKIIWSFLNESLHKEANTCCCP